VWAPEDEEPHIVLLDRDDPVTMSEWSALCSKEPGKATLPTVLVSKDALPLEVAPYTLKRPLVASRVFNVLDTIAQELQAAVAPILLHHRALVVDDSPTTRKQLTLELERLGIAVDLAETGEQALDVLNQGTGYDVIFLDVVLPGVDGYKLCKTIKRNKAHKRTPVIMLTGKGSPFDRVRGKFAGCNTYLTKPVSRERFQTAVHKYIA
jgi:twitching motility two-component system response regulator PilG